MDLVRHKGVAVPNLSYDAIFNPTHTVLQAIDGLHESEQYIFQLQPRACYNTADPIILTAPPPNNLLQHHPHEATRSVNRDESTSNPHPANPTELM